MGRKGKDAVRRQTDMLDYLQEGGMLWVQRGEGSRLYMQQVPTLGKTNPYNIWLWKPEWPNVTSSYNQWGLTLRTLKISEHGSERARGDKNWVSSFKGTIQWTVLLRYSMEEEVWKTLGVYRKIYLLISEHVLEGQGSLGDVTKNKTAGGQHFLLLPPSLDTRTSARTSSAQALSPQLPAEYPATMFSCGRAPSNILLARVHQSSTTSLALCKQPWERLVPLQSDFCLRERGR